MGLAALVAQSLAVQVLQSATCSVVRSLKDSANVFSHCKIGLVLVAQYLYVSVCLSACLTRIVFGNINVAFTI